MTHDYRLTYSGNTIYLYDTGSSYTYLMGYALRGGQAGLTVTEELRVQFHYTSDDAGNTTIRAALNAIVLAAAHADLWQESRGRQGAQVFLTAQPGDTGDTYRSEVVHLEHDIPAEWCYGQWAGHVLDVSLRITRRNFWENNTLVELSLSNGGGGPGTGGQTIYNHDDAGAGHDNYVKLAAAGAPGSLPAPVKVSLQNTYNDVDEVTALWLGQGVWCDVEEFSHIIEGEAAAYNVGGAAAGADASCSGGEYMPATWAVDDETLLYRFDNVDEGDAEAKRFRILARFFNAPGAVTFRVAVTYPAGATTIELQTTGPVLADATELLYDLGELDIPPWLERLTSDWDDVSLAVYGQIAGGTTVNLDFIHLQPIASGRSYLAATGGLEYGEYLIDDPDSGHIYTQTAAGDRAALFVVAGDPLMLWPGRINRYYALCRDASGADIARTLKIKLYVRARRQTL